MLPTGSALINFGSAVLNTSVETMPSASPTPIPRALSGRVLPWLAAFIAEGRSSDSLFLDDTVGLGDADEAGDVDADADADVEPAELAGDYLGKRFAAATGGVAPAAAARAAGAAGQGFVPRRPGLGPRRLTATSNLAAFSPGDARTRYSSEPLGSAANPRGPLGGAVVPVPPVRFAEMLPPYEYADPSMDPELAYAWRLLAISFASSNTSASVWLAPGKQLTTFEGDWRSGIALAKAAADAAAQGSHAFGPASGGSSGDGGDGTFDNGPTDGGGGGSTGGGGSIGGGGSGSGPLGLPDGQGSSSNNGSLPQVSQSPSATPSATASATASASASASASATASASMSPGFHAVLDPWLTTGTTDAVPPRLRGPTAAQVAAYANRRESEIGTAVSSAHLSLVALNSSCVDPYGDLPFPTRSTSSGAGLLLALLADRSIGSTIAGGGGGIDLNIDIVQPRDGDGDWDDDDVLLASSSSGLAEDSDGAEATHVKRQLSAALLPMYMTFAVNCR